MIADLRKRRKLQKSYSPLSLARTGEDLSENYRIAIENRMDFICDNKNVKTLTLVLEWVLNCKMLLSNMTNKN